MTHNKEAEHGYSLIELMIVMVIFMILLGIVSSVLASAMSTRARESRRTDALTSAQAALNIMSREISNSGFGIYDNSVTTNANNGLILADSNSQSIHFRANLSNVGPGPVTSSCSVLCTNDPGEDVTYFFDDATDSIVRYDPNGNPQTSVVVNKISNVTFEYIDYTLGSSTASTPAATPTSNTGRITITVLVTLDPVQGEPDNQMVIFKSEVTLRNSSYMLHQY
jgi:type II secretory pathway pseudopilin PulG